MRTSIKLLVALNFSFAAGSAACDDLTADDLADLSDGPVGFRDDECDDPPLCLKNSPYVGDYQFSNIRTRENFAAPDPSVNSADDSRWQLGAIQRANGTWMPFDFLAPDAEGRLSAYDYNLDTSVRLDEALQAFFMLKIKDYDTNPPTYESIPMWIRPHSVAPSPSSPTFNVWTYSIAAMKTPPTIDYLPAGVPASLPPAVGTSPWGGTYYSICPSSPQETGKALFLQHVVLNFDGPTAWLEDGVEDGSYDLKTPSSSVIACQGHAFSKPQEFLAITPNSDADPSVPGERSYGLAGYNAAANAYRAFYDGAPRTVLGTPVNFKDFAHNPPWFDQTTSAHLPPNPGWPIVGHYEFVLESVYDVDANGDVLGANCYYTDSRAPNGIHRLYNPPATNPNLPGWSSMQSCGATQSNWESFGPIGAFVAKLIVWIP
ncbi:hypothetical protein [Nannocystis radixulma]|uniref:Uncharacterized protein n=1 Tax=Nannocystis radixulma TaxID=2995305 RepID=A0ABT5BJ79_9BACT|nr:hypothetical protein [Nannocystis radixulma]MDC0673743.1 hypothetical protein [Nannocystis radixulma]